MIATMSLCVALSTNGMTGSPCSHGRKSSHSGRSQLLRLLRRPLVVPQDAESTTDKQASEKLSECNGQQRPAVGIAHACKQKVCACPERRSSALLHLADALDDVRDRLLPVYALRRKNGIGGLDKENLQAKQQQRQTDKHR